MTRLPLGEQSILKFIENPTLAKARVRVKEQLKKEKKKEKKEEK